MSSRLLGQRYRLVEAMGHGGTGTVWLGHDELADRQVAVKEVRVPDGLPAHERAALVDRQLREARICARLNHPAIATVHDVVEQGDRPWVVMELVQGRGLDAVVGDDGPLPLEQVAEIGVQALDALDRAHAAGLLHRGVKPSTIMLRDSGQVVLTDFGIAALGADSRPTQEDGASGSPGYLAPEQVNDGRTGPESDLWALGAALYFAAEGRPPFSRPTAAAADPDPPERALPLWPLLSEMLERDPAARPTIAESQARLAEFDPTLRPVGETGPQAAPLAEHPAPRPAPAAVRPSGAAAPPPGVANGHGVPPAAPRPTTPVALLLGGAAVLVLVCVSVAAILFAGTSSDGGAGVEGNQPPASSQTEDGEDAAPPAPDCDTAETPALATLVPEPELYDANAMEHPTYSESYCEWRTSPEASGADGYVSVQFLRSVDEGSSTGAEMASSDLAAESEEYGGEPVDDLGEEAAAWYDDSSRVGCVGSRVEATYVRVCYDAARSADSTDSIPQDEAITGAREAAAQIVPRLEES